MSNQEYSRVKALFLEACEFSSEEEQLKFLTYKCGDNKELFQEVLSLLDLADETLDPSASQRALFNAIEEHEEKNIPISIGPYKPIKVIGEGGMGTVYLAEQENPKRQVALKVIRSGKASHQLIKRFEFEAQVLGQLHHPGIAQIFEANVAELSSATGAEELPFFAMEYIDGVTLREYLKSQSPKLEEILSLFISICEAIEHAHQKGVIHRDLKPGNILVDSQGNPKILDFGVARATDSDVQATMMTGVGQMVGTLAYMSPEQVGGISEDIDTRSDVYSLGVILYELLSGQLPVDVQATSLVEAARQIKEDDATSLSTFDSRFRGDLDTIVAKALEKEKDRRYPTASALAKDIDCYLKDEPISARPASTIYQLKKFSRRNKGLVAGLVTAFAVLIIGISVSGILAYKSNKNENIALENEAKARLAVYQGKLSSATFASSVGDYAQALTDLDNVPEEFHSSWEYQYFKAKLNFAYFHKEVEGELNKLCLSDISFRENIPIGIQADIDQIKIQNLSTGEIIARKKINERLWYVDLSDDTRHVITWGLNTTDLRIYETESFNQIFETRDMKRKSIYELSSDGSLIAISDVDGLRVFDVQNSNLKFNRPNGRSPASDRGGTLKFSQDSSLLAWVPEGDRPKSWLRRMELIDCNNGELLGQVSLKSTPIRGLAFSDLDTVVSYSNDGSLQVIDLGNMWITRRGTIEVLSNEKIEDSKIQFFGDENQWLVVCGMDEVVRVIEFNSLKQLSAVKAPGRVRQLRISPDGKSLALSGIRNWIELWRWHFDSLDKGHRFISSVSSVAFNQQGNLVTGSADPDVRVFDPFSKAELARFSKKGRSLSLTFKNNSHFLDSLYRQDKTNEHYSWNLATREEKVELVPKDINTSDFIRKAIGGTNVRDGNYSGQLWATSRDGTLLAQSHFKTFKPSYRKIYIFKLDTNEKLQEFFGHVGNTSTVTFSHDNRWLASGGRADDLIKIWDINTGSIVTELKGHKGEIYSLDFSPDRKRLASGGRDRKLRIWDTEKSFELLASLEGHTSEILAVIFSPDGSQIATGSSDNTLKIWDSVSRVKRFQQVKTFQNFMNRVEPKIELLLKDEKTPAQIVEQIKNDSSLNEEQKRAAYRVLLSRTGKKKLQLPFF